MRILAVLLAVYHGANGLFMLALPRLWYASVPGVTETGPFNVHFVQDIGLAFLGASFALALFARRGVHHLVLWPAALFLGGHASLHLSEMLVHGATAWAALRDILTIVVPGLLPLVLIAVDMRRGEARA
jgi:hypothetical protein